MSNDDSTIEIERTSQWTNRARSIRIFVDNNEIGSVKNGRTERFSISPGNHEITAKIDWCRTAPIKISMAPGETRIFQLGSEIKGFRLLAALYYIIFDTKNYIYLREK